MQQSEGTMATNPSTPRAPTAPTRTTLSQALLDLIGAYNGKRGPIVIEARALGLDPADVDTMTRALGFVIVEEGPGDPRFVERAAWEARVRADAPRPVVKPAPAKPAAPVSPSRYWSTSTQGAGSSTSKSTVDLTQAVRVAQAGYPPKLATTATPTPARSTTAEIYARLEADARRWAGQQPAPDTRQATGPRTLAQIAGDVYADRASGNA